MLLPKSPNPLGTGRYDLLCSTMKVVTAACRGCSVACSTGIGLCAEAGHDDGEGRGVQPLTSSDPAEIGGYRLKARLGSGGMGRVYLASTPGGRAVALKVVRAELGDDPNFRTRLEWSPLDFSLAVEAQRD